MSRLRLRRAHVVSLLLSLVFVACAGPAAPARVAHTADAFPIFEVSGDDHLLNEVDDLSFEAYNLDAAGDTATVTIRTPKGFGASIVAHAVGARLGDAEVGTVKRSGGSITRFNGGVLVMSPAAFDADPDAHAC